MDKKDVYKAKNVYILGGIAFFLVLTTICAFFCHSSASRQASAVYVFDGWYFGREDQKKVGSVLGAAGLDEYTWESGKLSVPTAKKNEYQTALAVAGAYPQAPGESRLEALRESSVFESDSKLRMRELNACATQLERTIEQMRGVEYATVGYRSRREQSGLVAKNVVTASIGVALKDGVALDANFLAAVTIAAKHQLGIDEADDVSILDLKEGKSYLGVDNSRGVNSVDVAILEKERVENYWRDKYLEAFADVEGVRVSVVAELTNDVKQVKNEEKSSDARWNLNRDARELRTVSYARSSDNQSAEVPLQDEPNVLIACSLTKEDKEDSGFARLGNPKKKNVRTNATNQIQPLATTEDGRSVKNAPAPCLPLDGEGLGRRLENAIILASRTTNGVEDERGETGTLESANGAYVADSSRKSGVGNGIAQIGYLEKRDSNAERRLAGAELTLRSIIVRIAVPESYVQRVFQRVVAEKNKDKTFVEESTDERAALYRDTETKIIEETKKFAVALFRPTGERLGWTEDALENSFYVDVFSDASTTSADSVNFVSKYAAFDVLETESKGMEQNETAKDADETVKDADEAVKDADETVKDADEAEKDVGDAEKESNVSDASDEDLASSESGVVAKTLEKIAEIATTEESEEGEENSEFLALVKTLFDRCVKASKSPQTFVVAVLDAIAALFFYFYIKYRKILKKKKKACARSTASSETGAESTQKTTQTIEDEPDVFDDELERELLNIASLASSKRVEEAPKTRNDSTTSKERDFWEQRQTALDLIAKYPERAAASLQNWVKNPS